MQALFLTHSFPSLFSVYNSCRRHGQVRPDGGKEPWLTKAVLFPCIPKHRDGLFRELPFSSTPTGPGRLFPGSLFPRNPPSQKYGLHSLFLEGHPKFHCAALNVVCSCQGSHSRLDQWPICSFGALRTLNWLNINEPGGVCVHWTFPWYPSGNVAQNTRNLLALQLGEGFWVTEKYCSLLRAGSKWNNLYLPRAAAWLCLQSNVRIAPWMSRDE